jgi:hypothetical protein
MKPTFPAVVSVPLALMAGFAVPAAVSSAPR